MVVGELGVVVSSSCVELVERVEMVVGVADADGLRNEAFKPELLLNFAGTRSSPWHWPLAHGSVLQQPMKGGRLNLQIYQMLAPRLSRQSCLGRST